IVFNGLYVKQWADCSGNIPPNDAVQNTSNTQPLFTPNALNGYPIIHFDGINDNLLFPTGFLNNWSEFSFFIVVKPFTNNKAGIFTPSSTQKVGLELFSLLASELRINNSVKYSTGGLFSYGKFGITSILYNATKTQGYYNNLPLTLKSGGANLTFNGIYALGKYNSTSYTNFDIAELIIYNTALGNTDRQSVETYLRNKYSPPVNLGPDINISYGFCDTTLDAGSKFISYLWSTGETTRTIHVDSAGSYSVTTTDNILGLTSSDTITVNYPEINSHDTSFCSGSHVTLSTGLSGSYTYNWSNGLNTPTIDVSAAGNYWVTVTDENLCSKISNSITVTENNFTISLGPDTSICSGNSIGLILPSPLPPGLTYHWSNSETTDTIVVSTPGNYSITVTNIDGCIAKDTIAVLIEGTAPIIHFSATTGCSGAPTQFNNFALPIGNIWLWDFGDGQTSTMQNPSHIYYSSGGYYSVRFTVADGTCSNFKDSTIHIPLNPVAAFTIGSACINNPYSFSDQSTSAEGNIISWNWDFGDGTVHSSDTNPQHTYTSAGNFNVSLTVTTDKGCSNAYTSPITIVNNSTTPDAFTLYMPSDSFVTDSHIIDFAWFSSPGASSYTLEYSTDPLFDYNIILVQGLSSTFTQLYIAGSQTYYWRVTAYNICGTYFVSNIQKFSVFSATSISGLKLWLKADSAHLEGSAVDTLYDCSGNFYNAIQTNTNNKPSYVINNSANVLINGLPLIRFDGTNDNLLFPSGFLNNWSEFSFFTVVKPVTNNKTGIFTPSDNQKVGVELFSLNNTELRINNSVKYTTGLLNYGKFGLTSFIYNSTKTQGYFNTIPLPLKSGGGNSTYNGIYALGKYNNTNYTNFDIAELLIFNQALSNTDRQTVENYLRYKYAPPVYLGPDIFSANLCPDTIEASQRFINYKWNTGNSADTLHNLIVTSGGTYSVTATDVFGFTSTDEIIVNKPAIEVHDTTMCVNGSVLLNSGLTAPFTFLWLPDGSTANTLFVDTPNTYTLIVTDTFGCSATRNIIVSVDSFPLTASLGSISNVCRNDEIRLAVGAESAASYLWSDGETFSFFTVPWPSGINDISLTVTDTIGCTAYISNSVNVVGDAPTAGFTSSSACYPLPITLDDTSFISGANIDSLHWEFGDMQTLATTNSAPFTHNYDSFGIYNVSLTVTTDVGCKKTITQPVNVYSIPKPNFYPLLGCTGTPLTFHDVSTNDFGNITHWNWNFGDTGSAYDTSSNQSPAHIYNSEATNIVSLTVTSEYGCTDSVKIPVNIRISPVAGFTYTNVCDGNPVYFNDTSSTETYAQIFEWTWNINNDTINDLKNPVFSFDSAGVYQVILTVKSLNGCSASDTQNVVVHAIPIAKFNVNDTCAQSLYTFTDSSTVQLPDNISSWLWDFGSLGTSNDTNPTIIFPDSGSFHVKLTVTSNGGCKDTISQNINIFPIPTAAFVPDEFYGIAPFTATFANNSQGAVNYLWNFGDGQTSLDSIPSHTFDTNGVYLVTLTAFNEFDCSDIFSQQLMVIPTIADIAVSNVQAVKVNNLVTLSADISNIGSRKINKMELSARANGGSAFTEPWTNLDNPLGIGETISYTFNAKYEILENQLADYICVEAQIVNKDPDDNPSNNEQCITFSNQFIAFNPYPSPTHDLIYINFVLPFSYNVEIDLYGIQGEKIKNIFYGEAEKGLNKITSDVSALNLGVYVLRIKFRDDIKFLNFVKY
ncbi:MAG: PKD domain-containing protein, partial [Bacteroidetes bacterium]|nr:PKD domain-containing protein [Bacteroidota bacterium]